MIFASVRLSSINRIRNSASVAFIRRDPREYDFETEWNGAVDSISE